MNRHLLAAYARDLKAKNDKLREKIKSGALSERRFKSRIIIPRQLFSPSLELEASMCYFNGFIINYHGDLMVVDPGVDFYARFTSTGLSAINIRAIVISHCHIDHLNSFPIFAEKMLRNKSRQIDLFCSRYAYETKVPEYLRESIEKSAHINLFLLSDKSKNYSFKTFGNHPIKFISLYHGDPDTLGFKIDLGKKRVAYISDTGYAIKVKTTKGIYPPEAVEGEFVSVLKKHQQIKNFFSDADLAVVNINDLAYNRHSKYHLSAWDVLDIFQGSRVKKLILQHLLPINIEGEDSNYLFKLFFQGEKYQTVLPHYLGREIAIE